MRRIFSLMKKTAYVDRQLLRICRRQFAEKKVQSSAKDSKMPDDEKRWEYFNDRHDESNNQVKSSQREEEEYYARVNAAADRYTRWTLFLKKLMFVPLSILTLLFVFGPISISIRIGPSEDEEPSNPNADKEKKFNQDEIVTVVEKVDVGQSQVPVKIPVKKVIKFQDVIVG
jgi:hypothetical protein